MTATGVSPMSPSMQRTEPDEEIQDRLAEGPYKGLSYYEEVDAPFFFGRERETQIVVAKLMGSRLTVLYGQSGVGKSSVLRAGATRHLMEIARENVERRGKPRLVVAVFPNDYGEARATWRDDPVTGIMIAVERAVESLQLDIAPSERRSDLCKGLTEWTGRLRCDLVVILDQFEEYLLYHEGQDQEGALAVELPAALSQQNLRVNFLLSIREDMLAKLDSFKQRIPTIFDNCVRVSHLDREHARAAIEMPISTYNEMVAAAEPITIEPKLVDTILGELETGRVVVGFAGVGTSQAGTRGDAHPVETPYLQLVMTRLWREEMQAGSKELRLATLDRLGHCERIVKTHLDETMRTLPRYGRYVAARAFHHLVTPSGAKIAHSAADLSSYTGLAEHDIEPVLQRLTESDYRILRRVASSNASDGSARFEIFHDVLGAPILDWRSRYLRARDALEVVRGGATTFIQIVVGLAWLVFLLIEVFAKHTALWIIWAASALLVWISTTVVLVRWRQRREAWAVPLVGGVASTIGPLTALVSLTSDGLRLASRVSRRWKAAAREPRRRVPDAAVAHARLVRFSGLLCLIGAGVVVLACLLPAVEFDSVASLLASDDRIWFALEPLICAAMAGALGVVALVLPRPRTFWPGLVSGVGIGTLTYFFSLLWWDSALSPFVNGPGSPEGGSVRVGIFLGVAGAGLVLVSASPPVVLEIFASIIGAGRVLVSATGAAIEMSPSPKVWTVRVPLALCAAAAGVAALTAAFVASGAWHRPQYDSLFAISFWAGWQVVVPAVATVTAALAFLVGQKTGERAAGVLAGCGLALFTLFLGAIGIRDGDAPVGAYLGAGAGAGLTLGGILLFATARSSVRADRARERRTSPRVVIGTAGGALAIMAPVVLAVVLGAASSSLFGNVPAVGSVAHGLAGASATAQLFKGIPQKQLTLGSASAPVTMIEYTDTQCWDCGYFETTDIRRLVKSYIRSGKLRVVMRPVGVRGRDSSRGQAAVLAAARQNKAFNYEALLDAQHSDWLDNQLVASVAASIPGLLVPRLLAERTSVAVKAQAQHLNDRARSEKIRVYELPVVFVGRTGKRVRRVDVSDPYYLYVRVVRAIRKALASCCPS